MKAWTAVALALTLTLAAATPASAVEPALKLKSPEAARGTTAVTIGAFNVGFIFESVDREKQSGGLAGAFSGTTTAKSELDGVTPAMMQAITDAAYADFRAQLAARGFTVVDHAAMFANADVRRVKLMTAPYEASVALEKRSTGKASYYKPSALPGQFMLPGDVTSSGMSGMGLAMAAGTNQYGVGQYAKASGQGVLDVTYLIDFSEKKRPGAWSFGSLAVNSGMAVVDDYSKLNLVTPAGKMATIILNLPVAVEGDFAIKQDATKDAGLQKGVNMARGVAGVLGHFGGFGGLGMLGGGKMGVTRKFQFTAKPEYQAGATKAATLANTRLIEQLAALR